MRHSPQYTCLCVTELCVHPACCLPYPAQCHAARAMGCLGRAHSALLEARMGIWLCTFMPVRHLVCCMFSESISRAAEEALQQGSESQPQESSSSPPQAPRADPATGSGGGWKGQQGVIGDLVHLWVAWSPQPCQTMLRLLQGPLSQVPSQPLTGKKAQEPVALYPGDQSILTECGCADSWLKMRLQSNKQALALQQFGWKCCICSLARSFVGNWLTL